MYRAFAIPIVALLAHLRIYCLAQEPPGGYYRSRYDHIDIDTVMNSKRLVNYYGACLLGRGPCPPQGAELRRVLPEALQTNCARCTEKQKAGAFRTIKRLRKEYPDIWKELVEEYDPTEKYVRRFEETMLKKKPYLTSSSFPNRASFDTNDVQNPSPSPSNVSPVTLTTIRDVITTPASSNKIGAAAITTTTSTTSTTTTTTTTPNTASLSTTKPKTTNSFTTLSSKRGTPRPASSAGRQTTIKTDTRSTSSGNAFEPLPLFVPQTFSESEPPTKVTTNTVSLLPGVRLQVDTPNWLSSLGNRVIQTGTRIGKAVVSTVQAVVGL